MSHLHILKFKFGKSRDFSATNPRHHWGWHDLLNSLKGRNYVLSSDDESENRPPQISRKKQKRLSREKPLEKPADARKQQELQPNKEVQHASLPEDPPEVKQHYGDLLSTDITKNNRYTLIEFDHLTDDLFDQQIGFSARLHVIRHMGSKLLFLIFRQQTARIQGVLCQKEGFVSPRMIQWASHLNTGSIMYVRGVVRRPRQAVKGCTFHDKEIIIEKLHVLVRREESIPFSVYEAEICPEEEKRDSSHCTLIADYTRLRNRILDLRTQTSQSIFRIQAGIATLFRGALERRGFIEIHTPKLQGAATESGSSVFEVKYFDRQAFLAQSPQLAKQMAISADFGRVYEIGPVFRAEDSNTHRHLTEYIGLDIEMAIKFHYHEMLQVIDEVIKEIFSGLYRDYRREIDIVRHQFFSNDLVWLKETPILKFSDAVKLLNSSGWRTEDDKELRVDEDLHTRDEIRLGQLVKEKYGTDYYIVDKFPRSVRPFYTMPDTQDPLVTNSFDIFVRGQEILTGGQRIHDCQMLEENLRRAHIDPLDMEEYLEAFRLAAPPHAGAGIGLERLLMLFLDLKNIRFASMFHRDPKSFPAKPRVSQLRHPEASTLRTAYPEDVYTNLELLQPLENLVANYGDSTSTNWLDPRYQIWRDRSTGAAISYIPCRRHVIMPGDPLCDPSQYSHVMKSFLIWMNRELRLKPIWILISSSMEELLCEKLGWQSVSCIAENRVVPSANLISSTRGDIVRKIQHAKREGVRVVEVSRREDVSDELKMKINQRIQEWRSQRRGTQVHLSQILPWVDRQHRWYFYAVDKNGVICAFVVLSVLAPSNGMQIKYSFDFSGAPSGTIEYIITHSIQTASKSGVRSLTFGAGATGYLTAGHLPESTKLYLLQHTYAALAHEFQLAKKTEFRIKLGAYEDPLFIAYPPQGLGSSGIRDIVQFFKE